MSSPGGGVAGPSYSDGDIRHMIRVIIATPSPAPLSSPGANTPGPTSFDQERTKLKKYFGIAGQYWPEPGLLNYSHAHGVSDDANLRVNVQNEIEENYVLATKGKGTVLPFEDPGAAIPGVGPTGIGFGSVLDALNALKGFIDFIANPVRVGELVVGVIVLGVAFNAVMKQGFGANAPQIPGPVKVAKVVATKKVAK